MTEEPTIAAKADTNLRQEIEEESVILLEDEDAENFNILKLMSGLSVFEDLNSKRIPKKAARTKTTGEDEVSSDDDDEKVYSGGNISLSEKKLMKLQEMKMGDSKVTAYMKELTLEGKKWIILCSQDARGGIKIFSPDLESALESSQVNDVTDSIRWAMESHSKSARNVDIQSEMLVTKILQNKIASNKMDEIHELTCVSPSQLLNPKNANTP